MKDTFEFTLNNPLTEEQWDMITDADFDRTDRITFHTKHGKKVEFAKVILCKDCTSCIEQKLTDGKRWSYCGILRRVTEDDGFCAWAERKEGN